MRCNCRVTRRTFLQSVGVGTAALAGGPKRIAASAVGRANPADELKLGIRAASLKMVGDIDVIRTAASIPGIRGVELQTTAGKANLRDRDVVRRYKNETRRWGVVISSLAGVWDRGVTIRSPNASDSLIQSIHAAEMLGAGAILVAFFRQNAPDMNQEESYAPVVDLLRRTARTAADSGVVMGLENSLSPADNKKLVDLVDHPSVRVYYDLHNMAHYGYPGEAIPGVQLLGKQRICMIHVKNGANWLEEPGPIDWKAAFRAFLDIGYDGWYVYETAHDDTADCIADTKRNNTFVQRMISR